MRGTLAPTTAQPVAAVPFVPDSTAGHSLDVAMLQCLDRAAERPQDEVALVLEVALERLEVGPEGRSQPNLPVT